MDGKTLADRLSAVAVEEGGVSAAYRLLIVGGWVSAELTVRRYLSGKRAPTAEFVTTFCETFKVNPIWLLFGEGAKEWNREDAERQKISDARALVIRLLAQLDEMGNVP